MREPGKGLLQAKDCGFGEHAIAGTRGIGDERDVPLRPFSEEKRRIPEADLLVPDLVASDDDEIEDLVELIRTASPFRQIAFHEPAIAPPHDVQTGYGEKMQMEMSHKRANAPERMEQLDAPVVALFPGEENPSFRIARVIVDELDRVPHAHENRPQGPGLQRRAAVVGAMKRQNADSHVLNLLNILFATLITGY